MCPPRVSCGAPAACFSGTRFAGTFWRPCSHHRYGGGILFGSGLSLVSGPNDRCGTQHQSLRNDVSAPIVARGSSPTRTPSAFPLSSVRRQSSVSRLFAPARVRSQSVNSPPRPNSPAHFARERAERSSAAPCPPGDEARTHVARSAAAVADLCREARVSSQATTHERQSVCLRHLRATGAQLRTDSLGPLTSESPEPARAPAPTTYRDASRSDALQAPVKVD